MISVNFFSLKSAKAFSILHSSSKLYIFIPELFDTFISFGHIFPVMTASNFMFTTSWAAAIPAPWAAFIPGFEIKSNLLASL